ncbi:MAG: DUF2460 domain-containing protein [Acidobacteria bacterium]|nr:DUF2460 domain-containing protein [Acidobacteriota bacterium]
MSSFPRLKTGAVAQYPAVRELRSDTTVLRFVDGEEQRYRASAGAVRRWEIRLELLDEDELEAVERLFREMQGRSGSFQFRDPWDGRLYEDCSFEDDEFAGQRSGEQRGEASFVVRENRS